MMYAIKLLPALFKDSYVTGSGNEDEGNSRRYRGLVKNK